MDSSDDSDDQFFSYPCFTKEYIHLTYLSTIHKAVIDGDLSKVIRCIKSGVSVNKVGSGCDVSPLHIAVIFNKLEILDYLLAEEDVEVDARCCQFKTPLHMATRFGHIECVLKLIQAGCDINATDKYGETALHQSVISSLTCMCPEPPVHRRGKILSSRLDILHILLYYNADANIPDFCGRVPFFAALSEDNEEAQKVLLDYVTDFNRFSHILSQFSSIVGLALLKKSPFVKDIIERGGDINYGDDPRIMAYDSAFSICLRHSLDSSMFKMVWERLRYNNVKNTIDLLNFLNYDDAVPTFLQVIIESDNFETAIQFFSKEENYFLFVNKFAEKKFNFDQLMALTCRLLEHGFRPSSYDVHAIFSLYGYCELFRILLYMDNDYSRGWLPDMALTRIIFDIDYNLKSFTDEINYIPKEEVYLRLIKILSGYYRKECINAILGRLPRLPSLMDLARNPARKQIWQSFKITNTCQFYTTIDHLDIPTVCKNILTFRRKMVK